MSKRPINPSDLADLHGFAHAWLVESTDQRTLYLAGQCGSDQAGKIVAPGDLAAQLDTAMANIGCVLRDAGMRLSDIVQLNLFVRRRDDYATARHQLGQLWRQRSGRLYPAMAMFVVQDLHHADALIEIQGIACAETVDRPVPD